MNFKEIITDVRCVAGLYWIIDSTYKLQFKYSENEIENRSRHLGHIDRRNNVDDIVMGIGEIREEKIRRTDMEKLKRLLRGLMVCMVKGKEKEDMKTFLRQTKIKKKRHIVRCETNGFRGVCKKSLPGLCLTTKCFSHVFSVPGLKPC